MKNDPRLLRLGIAAVGLGLLAASATAQNVYRNVDKNGRVIFSDQPAAAVTAPAPAAATGNSVGSGGGALPYELRQVTQRYPVTLYTGDDCGPCSAARSLLVTRGVPFDERTIKSPEDIEALTRLSGQNSLPLLSIGSQQLKGFSDSAWSQYLDAAGYPKASQLPATYRNPPARPLVAVQNVAPPEQRQATPGAAAPVPAPSPSPAAPATGPTPSNPAGIRF